MAVDKISHERLLMLVSYDPLTGLFTNRVRRSMSPAGTVLRPRNRIAISIEGRHYQPAHLVWFFVHGKWPDLLIDHIDTNPENNRIENLREANTTQNAHNRKVSKKNKSGFKGVNKATEANRWQATIKAKGKKIYIGIFHTPEEAHAAYVEAATRLFGEFARAA